MPTETDQFAGTLAGEVYQLTDSTVTVALDRAVEEAVMQKLAGGRQQLVQVPNSVTYARQAAGSTSCPVHGVGVSGVWG
jgi:hypothetical protein